MLCGVGNGRSRRSACCARGGCYVRRGGMNVPEGVDVARGVEVMRGARDGCYVRGEFCVRGVWRSLCEVRRVRDTEG